MTYDRDYLRQLDAEDMATLALRQSRPSEFEIAMAEELLSCFDAIEQNDKDRASETERADHAEDRVKELEEIMSSLQRELEEEQETSAKLLDQLMQEAA